MKKSKFTSSYNTYKNPELAKIIDEYAHKIDHLTKITKMSEDKNN